MPIPILRHMAAILHKTLLNSVQFIRHESERDRRVDGREASTTTASKREAFHSEEIS